MRTYTVHELKALFPKAKTEILLPLTDKSVFNHYGIKTDLNYKAFIAQAAHETAYFTTLEEALDSPTAEAKYGASTRCGKVLGNLHKGDGAKFKGRGYLQITGRWNYAYLERESELKLVSTPELLLDPEKSLQACLEWWNFKGLHMETDFDKISRKLNGGTNGLADRRRIYNRLTEASNNATL